MDKRWDLIVTPNLSKLVTVLNPTAFLFRLRSRKLITSQEMQEIRQLPSKQEMAYELLDQILPRKGPKAYSKFVEVLMETEGQEHIATDILKRTECVMHEELIHEAEMEKLKRDNEALKSEALKWKSKCKGEALISLGLRIKEDESKLKTIEPQWRVQMLPPLPACCRPCGRVIELNGSLIVGRGCKLFYLEKGSWKSKTLEASIWSVLTCGNDCYVMGQQQQQQKETKTLKIYQWKFGSESLAEMTQLPEGHQLTWGVSAIGSEEKIYVVGGYGPKSGFSNQVNSYEIRTDTWTKMKGTTIRRAGSSLAILGDDMYIGGGITNGGVSNQFECLPLIGDGNCSTLPPTTSPLCQIAKFNEQLVVVGGWGQKSNCFEVYDIVKDRWLPLPSLNRGRYAHGLCSTQDNRLLAVRGFSEGQFIECFYT